MGIRRLLTSAGAGVTTFLLVTVLIIETLAFEFSAIVGLPVGFLAGFTVATGLYIRRGDLRPGIRRLVSAYAAFGLTILLLLGLSYVDIGRELFSLEMMTATAVVAAVVVFAFLWLIDRARM